MMKIILALFLPYAISGWWDVGHMLTAAVAQLHLQKINSNAYINFKELVESINPLTDDRSRTFIQSSCWPDDIKSKNYNMHLWDSWHFKDMPDYQNINISSVNFTESSINSMTTIINAAKVLQTNLYKHTAERALFARYLIHVVGDIHQPLHSISYFNSTYKSGDRGGNLIKVYLQKKKINLHAFLDSGAMLIQNNSWELPRPLNRQNTTTLLKRASSLIEEYGEQIQEQSEQLDPEVWVQQSFNIAKNKIYPYVETTNSISKQFQLQVYELAKRQITLAGYRLGNMIIKIYEEGIREESMDRKWGRMKEYAKYMND